MTDEPQKTAQPAQPGPGQAGQPPQNRYHGRRPHRHVRERQQPAAGSPQPKEPEAGKPVGLDEDESDEERTTQRSRPRGRGGRPEKKVYEEWINDPYCE